MSEVYVVVEGRSDVGLARRLVEAGGHYIVGDGPKVMNGISHIKKAMTKYAQLSTRMPVMVLVDADNRCPVERRDDFLASAAGVKTDGLIFRVAVRESEAWLMGDAEGLASFFFLSERRVPLAPETLPDPKASLYGLVLRDAKNRQRRDGLVMKERGSGRLVGAPRHPDVINDYVTNAWDPDRAAERCPSLARALAALRALP